MALLDAPPAVSPPAASRRSRRKLGLLFCFVAAVIAGLVSWTRVAQPEIFVSAGFSPGPGAGEYIGEEEARRSPSGVAPGYQATALTASVSTVVRNDGRFPATVSAGSVPPNIRVEFGSIGAATEAVAERLRLSPGEQAVVHITATGRLCSPDGKGSVSPYFALKMTSLGLTREVTLPSELAFDLERLPALCAG